MQTPTGVPPATWIVGGTRSGKTTALVTALSHWQPRNCLDATVLVFAANSDNRAILLEQLLKATEGEYQVRSTTPLGFFQDEVMLFWPLLLQSLQLTAQFPLPLRPENEQELATRLWRSQLDQGQLRLEGVAESRLVRRTLDLMQLAALSGVEIGDIANLLSTGFLGQEARVGADMGAALTCWRDWCLQRGLLTYGLVADLYGHYLLPHPTYQQHLIRRFQGVLADDVDEYPAIARQLFEYFLDQQVPMVFTYNPEGAVRLGLGADPHYLAALAARCQVIALTPRPMSSLGDQVGQLLLEALGDFTPP
ncbi:hypothetical protein [Neosynechococcus sphagnicola]|uniref:hypothetical protein n=1 Tax=Neosynechococcus sphagnicola TaxID=1501145 RepID=UPI000A42F03F|nr:hypothetical protein [Neosynechococcus sphagnicola]